MSPNTPTTIAPLVNGSGVTITPAPTFYIGPNTSVKNDTSQGLLTTLPITTQNVLTSQGGLNINSSSGVSKLTVDSNGNLSTQGSLSAGGSLTLSGSLNANALNIGSTGNEFTVSDSGLTTINDDLIVGSNFKVTESTGSVTIGGTVYSSGTITVGGTAAIPNLTLGNDGHITASNDVTIGASSISLHAGSGNAEFNGTVTVSKTLNVNSDQLLIDSVNNVAEINCPTNILGSLNINSSKFTVDSSSGDVATQGSLSINNNLNINSAGDLTSVGSVNLGSSKILLNSSTGAVSAVGNLSLGSNFASPTFKVDSATGAATTQFAYSSYNAPSSSDNTETTSVSGPAVDFTSSTSQHLVTQTYVDQQLWKQTVRINTILGSDNSVLDSFNNVYKLVTALEGSTTATAIGGLVDETSEIKITVSDVVSRSFNTVLVNCSPSVWPDESSPMPIPYNTPSLDGWYFKNIVDKGSKRNKINWYLPTNGTMKMSDFINVYANFFIISKTSLPFITIYTKAKGNSSDVWTGIANTAISYTFDSNLLSSVNKHYCLHIGDNAPANNFNVTPNKSTYTTTRNKSTTGIGSQRFDNKYDPEHVSPNDEILMFSVQSDSSSSTNNVEFVLNSFNIQQLLGTTQMLFQNSSVSSNYMFNNLYKKNMDFSPMTTENVNYLNAYNALYNST